MLPVPAGRGLLVMSAPQFLRDCPQFLFFTGKGGVGKTSIASASAVHLADEGKRVLLVSTDPASNLAEVLATPIGHRLTAIPGVVGLTAIEIDPELAAVDYRERILSPLTGQLPEAELTAAREQLSGSCTTEVAAFDEFTSYLADPQVIRGLTTSCSTRRLPVTPSDCCSCPAPGPPSWPRGRATPRAWVRWRGWTSTAPRTPPRLRLWLTRR